MPVLGGTVEQALERGDVTLAATAVRRHEPVLRYYDHVFPVRPGTEDAAARRAASTRQHYRLAYWRVADEELELPAVLRRRPRWSPCGSRTPRSSTPPTPCCSSLDARRRDRRLAHRPPGRAGRPRAATSRGCAEATGGAWVVVEKILEGDERLPDRLAVRRHDRLRRAAAGAAGALVDPAGADALDRLWRMPRPTGSRSTSVVAEAKRQVVDDVQAAEVDRLTASGPRVLGRRRPRRGAPSASRRCSSRWTATAPTSCPGGARPRAGRRLDAAADRARAAAGAERPRRARRGGRARARARPGAGPARHRRPGRRVPRAVPADLRAGHGQGHRGHRLLPLAPARGAQRGRRRPRPPVDLPPTSSTTGASSS